MVLSWCSNRCYLQRVEQFAGPICVPKHSKIQAPHQCVKTCLLTRFRHGAQHTAIYNVLSSLVVRCVPKRYKVQVIHQCVQTLLFTRFCPGVQNQAICYILSSLVVRVVPKRS